MRRRAPRSTLFPYTTLFRSVVTKTELLDTVWGDRFVSESALASRLKSARRAVGDDGAAQRVIRTVFGRRSEEHTSELQSQSNLVCRLLLEKKKSAVAPWGAS